MKLYALKKPSGELVCHTIGGTKSAVWYSSFNVVARENKGFEDRYWKKFDASLRAAKRLGYSIVPIVIGEACEP